MAKVPGNRDPLSKRDLDPDPIAQFRVWLDDAQNAGIRLPEAVALATVGAGGRPSVRHVLLRGIDERGFVFYTNYASRTPTLRQGWRSTGASSTGRCA